MIIRVAEITAQALGRENAYIATDDGRIADAVEKCGFKVIMTSSKAMTGTDRIAEAAGKIDADIYVNVQGDEPLLDPKNINKIAAAKEKYIGEVINCMCPIGKDEKPEDVNIPKVVTTEDLRLIYMSRLPVPGSKSADSAPKVYWKQVCIYAFSKKELKAFSRDGRKSYLEGIEDIEILRFLELGIPVRMIKVAGGSKAVDLPGDVEAVESILKSRAL